MNALANMQKTIDSNGDEVITALEKNITLALIDDSWKEHLRSMDDLKQSVRTASYEQKDPLVIYKIEAFNLFKKLDAEINKNIVSFLCHAALPVEETNNQQVREAKIQKTDMSRTRANKDDVDARGDNYAVNEGDLGDDGETIKQMPVTVEKLPGRNDACPCGSGKKYKACHGK